MLKPVQTDFFKQSVFSTDKMISLNKIRQSCLTSCLRKLNRNYHISLNLHGISVRSAFISCFLAAFPQQEIWILKKQW